MSSKAQTKIADPLPWSNDVTPYDEAHFVTYLRLLDAKSAGISERQMCRTILELDPACAPDKAARILRDHLRRATWMTETGYKALLRQDG